MLHARRNGRLSAQRLPDSVGVWNLLAHGADNGDIVDGAFAWVISQHCNPHADVFVPALALPLAAFERMLARRFAHFCPPPAWLAAQNATFAHNGVLAEFADLLQLLTEHLALDDENHLQVAHLLATACMGSDHLWQDLGLADRRALSVLMQKYFPSLAAKNVGDMKWKKFFYKQLCAREGINSCRAPSCAACTDHEKCFGPEE